jgi:Na+-translocating ferredoxin:NAD+ oxidoreductase subunit G
VSEKTIDTLPVLDGAGEKTSSGFSMILAMGGIGLTAAVLIVLTYQLTFPAIEKNKAAALERAVFEVVPGAASMQAFVPAGEELRALGAGESAVRKYYACYGEGGAFLGVAVEASGQGFQDIVRLLYGYSPASGRIVGMKVLESKETPGLGDKIMKDPAFLKNFEALDVTLDDAVAALAHPIAFAKHGEKSEEWQVEGITGATISSRAVASILNEGTNKALPLIQKNIEALEGGAP